MRIEGIKFTAPLEVGARVLSSVFEALPQQAADFAAWDNSEAALEYCKRTNDICTAPVGVHHVLFLTADCMMFRKLATNMWRVHFCDPRKGHYRAVLLLLAIEQEDMDCDAIEVE